MGNPWYVICCFSFAVLMFFSLSLIWVNLINMSQFPLGIKLYRTLCFLDLSEHFLSHVREISGYYLFTGPFSLFTFWDPYNVNILGFNVWEVARLPSFNYFFFILFHGGDFHQCVFLLICSSVSHVLLLIPSGTFFISVIALFICFLNLLALFETFIVSSQSLPPFFFCYLVSVLLSPLCILFHIDCLSPIHLVVLRFLFCSFVWDILLCSVIFSFCVWGH